VLPKAGREMSVRLRLFRSLYNHLAADFWAVMSFLLVTTPGVPGTLIDATLRQYEKAEDRVSVEYAE
jgi:hypothetical protein